jgi:hypothetical protein
MTKHHETNGHAPRPGLPPADRRLAQALEEVAPTVPPAIVTQPPDDLPPLSPEDQRHLAAYETAMQTLRDRVAMVATGRLTGMYAYGPAGGGKSYAVQHVLLSLGADYRAHNSRCDGAGLITDVEMAPSAIHTYEDSEPMFRNRNVLGLLRSLLWGVSDDTGRMVRRATWPRSGGKPPRVVTFRGGIIMLMNSPPSHVPEMLAVCDRLGGAIRVDPTPAQIRAKCRDIARHGYDSETGRHLPAEESMAICEFVVRACSAAERTITMRLLAVACEMYLAYSDGLTGGHWTDQVRAAIYGDPDAVRGAVDVTPAAQTGAAVLRRQAADIEVAREILATTDDPAEQIRIWQERTRSPRDPQGKSRASWYRWRGRAMGQGE